VKPVGKLGAAFLAMESALIDLRYGAWIGGTPLPKPDSHVAVGAYSFTNTSYRVLEAIFRGRLHADDVLVDVGSGRGRVLNHWLHVGHRGPIHGLELDTRYAGQCARRLRRFSNVFVRPGDAVANLPPETTLCFLFNPFDRSNMLRFREAVLGTISDLHRFRVVYYAPTCLDVWTDDLRWDVTIHRLDLWSVRHQPERYRTYAVITCRNPTAPDHRECAPDGDGITCG
jgi:hypothetical protein